MLVPLFEREGDGEVVVILIKRPETMPSHRGEIAFPGGRLQPSSDDSSLAAALREAEEEVGLRPEQVEVVAELDSVDTVVSGFVVSPFVGLLTAPPRLVPDPREVVDILQVPLSRLLEEGVYREEHWPGMRGVPDEDRGFGWRAIHFFELEDETVWGLTARILASFLTRLVAGR